MFSKRTLGGAHTHSFIGILNDNQFIRTYAEEEIAKQFPTERE
jgi:hypothetical protein